MRIRRNSIALGCFLGGLALLGSGCLDALGDFYVPLTDPKLATWGSGGSSSSTTGTGGEPPGCAGDPTVDATLVRDECGVFVRASAAAGGKGTKTSPYQTFAEAAGAADVKRIYACAESYTETAPIVFTGGVEIYAGFTECDKQSGWAWTAASKASLTGPADMVSLTLNGGANHIENMNVATPNASIPGGSAVAMLVSGGSLDMSEGSIAAGDAMAGAAGMSLMDDMTLDGDPGDNGVGICGSGVNNKGPMGKTKTCPAGDSSTAGNGGDGGEFMMSLPQPAGDGGDGIPKDGAQATDGKGGVGEGTLVCKDGTGGVPGGAGDSGDGAIGYGAISAKDLYQGAAGKDGTAGKPGQGGGGGGGAKGGLLITCMAVAADRVGASGGAGGTGGCGGAMGGGGKAGGSSIALVVLDATVKLTNATLMSGKGGDGGKGGNGQSGGSKGGGGAFAVGAGGTNDSCQGQSGGKGGKGGPGGGGHGGHSLGIAFKGKTAPSGVTFTPDPLKKGSGGPGGLGNTTANGGNGGDGRAEACWDFGKGMACSP